MKKQLLLATLVSGLAISVAQGEANYTTSTNTKILSGLCFAVPAVATGALLYHTPTQDFTNRVLYYGIGAAFIGLAGWAGYTIINWFTPEGRFATASGYVEEVRKDGFITSLKRDGHEDVITIAEDAWVNSEFPLADAFDQLKAYRSNLQSAAKLFNKVLDSSITDNLRELTEGYLEEIPLFLPLIENAMKLVKKAPEYLEQVKAKNEKLARIAQQKAASAAQQAAFNGMLPQTHYVHFN